MSFQNKYTQAIKLPPPARYFPIKNKKYEISAGLTQIDKEFGNGEIDHHLFQIDSNWEEYRNQKILSRSEDLEKYYINFCTDNRLQTALVNLLVESLVKEHPFLFRLTPMANGVRALDCRLSRETIIIDKLGELMDVTRPVNARMPEPEYTDSVDALVSQLQEDITLVKLDEIIADRILMLHLCFPNHWAAVDKVGTGFSTAHAPVPHMEKINRQAPSMLKTLINKGPFVRFAWGLATDMRLNHHPEAPEGVDKTEWKGRGFTESNNIYMRIERQVTFGIPVHNAFLFSIRTYFRSINEFTEHELSALWHAVEGMDEQAAGYKGLWKERDRILHRLNYYTINQDQSIPV